MMGGDIQDYRVYPVKKGDGGRVYFSPEWRQLDIPFIPKLFDLAPCVVLRDGKIIRVLSFRKGPKYIQVYLSDVMGRIRNKDVEIF
jgi:hypothetical protein